MKYFNRVTTQVQLHRGHINQDKGIKNRGAMFFLGLFSIYKLVITFTFCLDFMGFVIGFGLDSIIVISLQKELCFGIE